MAGNVITEGYFYVGAEVTIHGHCFRITQADEKTLRLMEERAGEFPYSDPVRAAEILGGWVEGRIDILRAELRQRDNEVGTMQKNKKKRHGTSCASHSHLETSWNYVE